MGNRASDWCIIQTSSAGTLALSAALNDAGIEAWTPSSVAVKRVGKTRDRVEQIVPLMPTFVFARYDRLHDLIELSQTPAPVYLTWDKVERRMVMRGRPFFRIFRHGPSYPAVADRELDRLRIAEQRGKPVDRVRIFKPGEAVRVGSMPSFEGLVGVIEEVKGSCARVRFCAFGGEATVTIDARRLLSAA
ncbi:hypothetical protein LL251_17230 [Sphingobium naphthae]|nr:hypothetical protein [Sphingobium naphthae]MEC7932390.1 hypothetical protein [Pseudomonadota bacterium]